MPGERQNGAWEAATRRFVPLDEHEAQLVQLVSEGAEPSLIARELETTPEAIEATLASLVQRLASERGI